MALRKSEIKRSLAEMARNATRTTYAYIGDALESADAIELADRLVHVIRKGQVCDLHNQ